MAKCVEIEVASQGKTKIEALENLKEALSLYFKEESIPQPAALSDLELHQISSYA